MFTELSLGCWLSGYRNLYMYQASVFHSVFLCQLHAHTCPLCNVLLEVGCCCFPRNDILLNLTFFVGSQNFISLSSFMFVGQNKQKGKINFEIDYFQFKTFPGHIIYPFFNQRYLLSTCMHSIC